MPTVNYSELKAGGFMKQIQKNRFSLRLKIVGGQVTAEQLQKVAEVAQKFGEGYVHLTSRQGIEIPFIRLEDINEVKTELAGAGLQPGACGPRIRTITACQGCTICPNGWIDTTALAKKMDQRYFGRELPHKFKIGITGCGNNCLKAEENDLGIKGAIQPRWQSDSCSFCGLCQAICPTKAIKVDRDGQKVTLNTTSCTYCGKCIKACPTEAWTGKQGYLVYFGGLFGNQIATGRSLLPMIEQEENLYRIADAALDFFQKQAKQGERFGLTLKRVGWDEFAKVLEEQSDFKDLGEAIG